MAGMASNRTSWERRTERPLAGAPVVFLVAWAWPILDPDLTRWWPSVCMWTTWAVWAFFGVDYAIRLVQATGRRRWFMRHMLDLIVLALPLLRPLRLLRLVTLLRVLNRSASTGLRGRVAVYVGGGSLLLALVAALAVLQAERGVTGANIRSLPDALWWACTTMTTVGYADHFPVSDTGRLVGAGLMIAGIALLGTVTATLASWLVDAVQDEAEETGREVERLRQEVSGSLPFWKAGRASRVDLADCMTPERIAAALPLVRPPIPAPGEGPTPSLADLPRGPGCRVHLSWVKAGSAGRDRLRAAPARRPRPSSAS